jgi:hypothetical protein
MNTRQNLSKVFAMTLRTAIAQIRLNEEWPPEPDRVVLHKRAIRHAVESIESVAEELEAIATQPDAP